MAISKTSIIIPCHNYGKYLSLCIESVLTQKRLPLEIIVIDDDSTDKTEEVAKRYLDNIKYIKVAFKNAQNTRNFGIKQAKGDFFYLLDADDFLDEKAIEMLEDTLIDHPECKLVYSSRYNIGNLQLAKKKGGGYVKRFQTFSRNELEKRNYIPMHSLVRKECFYGFDERIKKGQDWEAWLNILKKDTDAIYIDTPLFFYRFHGKNLTFTEDNRFFERLKVLIKHSLFSYEKPIKSKNFNYFCSKSCIILLHSPEKTDFDYLATFLEGSKKNLRIYLTGNEEIYRKNNLLKKGIVFEQHYNSNPDLLLQKIRNEQTIYKHELLIISSFSTNSLNFSLKDSNGLTYFNIDKLNILNLNSFVDLDTIVFTKSGTQVLLDIPDYMTSIFNIIKKKILTLTTRHLLWRLKYTNR